MGVYGILRGCMGTELRRGCGEEQDADGILSSTGMSSTRDQYTNITPSSHDTLSTPNPPTRRRYTSAISVSSSSSTDVSNSELNNARFIRSALLKNKVDNITSCLA